MTHTGVSMSTVQDLRIPKYPECWDSCGNCASGVIFVQSVLVSAGDTVCRDDTVLVLETGKVALDIPSPWDGVVVDVLVEENDPIDEGQTVLRIETS